MQELQKRWQFFATHFFTNSNANVYFKSEGAENPFIWK